MKYSILDSVTEAYSENNDVEIKAEIFLTLYRRNDVSNNYRRASGRIRVLNYKIDVLSKYPEKNSDEISVLNDEIITLQEQKEKFVKQAIEENEFEISNPELIAERLVGRYMNGLGIKDRMNGIGGINSAYGVFVYSIFDELSNIPAYKKIFLKKESETDILLDLIPELRDKEFLESREGGLIMESKLILFLLFNAIGEMNDSQKKEILNRITKEVSGSDEDLEKKLNEAYRTLQFQESISLVFSELMTAAASKGALIGTTIKIPEIIMKLIAGKGMDYLKHHAYRKYLVRTLGSGGFALAINIAMLIPDAASLINRRDYTGVIATIFLLYELRQSH